MLENRNPMEGKKVIFVENSSEPRNADGVCGHLEAIGPSDGKRSFYDRLWKRGIDIILSLCLLIILSPLLLMISIAIFIDDPGPIVFSQMRIGLNKKYFKLHKFRTMKMVTPHDVPTHMLQNPDQYITRVGKFLRKHSIDELPQIVDILFNSMSTIGPRPALWNQDILTAERDKYGANDIKPGLTGWAQINGRDELEIPVKAKLDGEYAQKLKKGGFIAFLFDCRCFIGTISSVLRGEGVVEGGTGTIGTSSINPNDGKTVLAKDSYHVGKQK
jgi:O-antigen biosynthesis protein WbqP